MLFCAGRDVLRCVIRHGVGVEWAGASRAGQKSVLF